MKSIYLLLIVIISSQSFGQSMAPETFFDNEDSLQMNTDYTSLIDTGNYKLDNETVLGITNWMEETGFYGRKENDSVYYGFTFSNIQDSITPGTINDRAAYPAIGAENSENYGIAHGTNYGGHIDAHIGVKSRHQGHVYSAYVTNATITALSMMHGDSMAKKFGGINGTDPDWLKLTVYGYDYLQNTKDSIEVFLADFRSDDPAKDYILKEWKRFDLFALGEIDSMSFALSSSDNDSISGMRTPAYFCLDNLKVETKGGINSNERNTIKATIFPNPTIGILNIKTEIPVDIEVYDITGKLLLSEQNSIKIDTSPLNAGTYILKIKTRKPEAFANFLFVKNTKG